MKMRTWMYALIALPFAIVSCDDSDDNNQNANQTLEETDQQFVQNAAMSNMVEVDFGTIAASKATNEAVRAYGQMMVDEHTTAQTELQGIADDFRNVTWPQSLDPAHQQIRQQLLSLTGHQFDSVYIASQVNDHQMTLTNFETEISQGKNAPVKAYATKYRPHIEEHLERADSISNVLMAEQPGS